MELHELAVDGSKLAVEEHVHEALPWCVSLSEC